jgi:hypothetical protein
MADGDEIHAGLPRRYLSSYKDLCAPGFNAEDVAHEVARVVVSDVKAYGKAPLDFIAACVDRLQEKLPTEPLLRQGVDFGAIQWQIDSIARRSFGSETGIDLAKRAIRLELEVYRQGGDVPSLERAMNTYLMNIHDARFSQRVPLTNTHLNGLSDETINARLSEVHSYSETEYRHIARSLMRNPNTNRPIQRRRYSQGLGLHDEVL